MTQREAQKEQERETIKDSSEAEGFSLSVNLIGPVFVSTSTNK